MGSCLRRAPPSRPPRAGRSRVAAPPCLLPSESTGLACTKVKYNEGTARGVPAQDPPPRRKREGRGAGTSGCHPRMFLAETERWRGGGTRGGVRVGHGFQESFPEVWGIELTAALSGELPPSPESSCSLWTRGTCWS